MLFHDDVDFHVLLKFSFYYDAAFFLLQMTFEA